MIRNCYYFIHHDSSLLCSYLGRKGGRGEGFAVDVCDLSRRFSGVETVPTIRVLGGRWRDGFCFAWGVTATNDRAAASSSRSFYHINRKQPYRQQQQPQQHQHMILRTQTYDTICMIRAGAKDADRAQAPQEDLEAEGDRHQAPGRPRPPRPAAAARWASATAERARVVLMMYVALPPGSDHRAKRHCHASELRRVKER